jgi:hypothetical protein
MTKASSVFRGAGQGSFPDPPFAFRYVSPARRFGLPDRKMRYTGDTFSPGLVLNGRGGCGRWAATPSSRAGCGLTNGVFLPSALPMPGRETDGEQGEFFACSAPFAGIELFYKLDHSHPNLSRVLHRQSGPRENPQIGTAQRIISRASGSLRSRRCPVRLAG